MPHNMQKFVVNINDSNYGFQSEPLKLADMAENDLLVRPLAVSVNPVDTKLFNFSVKQQITDKVLGFDAVAEIVDLGSAVEGFEIGDTIYYAGDMTRAGSFADQQLIDYQLVSKVPQTISISQAAAFPLVSITAYEALFEKLGVSQDPKDNENKTLLMIGGAGGVGSMTTQLAKRVGLKVVATASREESKQWCHSMGADQTVDHFKPLAEQLDAEVDYILCAADTDPHLVNMAESIKPFGDICILSTPANPVDLNLFKNKSVSLHWEFMFTHSLCQTKDRYKQGQILKHMAELIDTKQLKLIDTVCLQGLTADNLQQALQTVAAGKMCGKLVIEC